MNNTAVTSINFKQLPATKENKKKHCGTSQTSLERAFI